MSLTLYNEYLIWFFILALVLGAFANRSGFCTMGAVSDWINFGNLDRMRAWGLAMSVAIIGVAILEYIGHIDMNLTTQNDTSTPPYRFANFVWLRYLLGGLIFGTGMTLASGCGNKTLVRLGAGNLKSLVVLVMMLCAASLMLFTNFDAIVFLQWMTPLSFDFSQIDATGQDIGSIIAALFGIQQLALTNLTLGLLIGGLLLLWVIRSARFRNQPLLWVSSLVIGGLVLLGWYLTAGEQGQILLEEIEFMDVPPPASGAQSLTFIAPVAHLAQYVYQGFSISYLSLGIVVLGGVLSGSFLCALIFGTLRLEWFADWADFFRHLTGGFCMGIGGVLAMGCTIGQGVTGISTLALGSFIAVISIIFSSSMTMKYQYYRMVYEEHSRYAICRMLLADMHLLPSGHTADPAAPARSADKDAGQ